MNARPTAAVTTAAVTTAATAVLGVTTQGRSRLQELAKGDPSEDVRNAAIEQLRRGSAKSR